METYHAFGLTLRSELSLPCLPSSREGDPDIEIGYGAVEEKGLENPLESGPSFQCNPGLIWLKIPGVGRFQVSGGMRIRIDPEPNADEQSIRLFVLGSCMGAILHQRGFLVLHGSALRFGDQCVAFIGDSGAGKSTTAAALRLRGHEILADDVSVIDGLGRVHAGFPQVKLWADTARHLGMDTGALPRIRPNADKYAVPVESGFCGKSMPLTAVFVLRTHGNQELLFEPVRGMDKMRELIRHTYRFEYVRGLGQQVPHVMNCSRIANFVRMTVVTRPVAGIALDEWLDRLEPRLPRVPTDGVPG